MQEKMWTVTEVAQHLRVSDRTVRHWVETGQLPIFPIGKRGYRIADSDLTRFVEERKRFAEKREHPQDKDEKGE